ncbi:putative phage domain protein [Candidatus Cyrtobacter comes]|uniref:Phage domain protein n=1 Tax=Candidatus Cyrtobacter comes TaxID=675776 RepID=A0ABU5L7Y2_9RICK|nr:glycoside hydrolase TIM-barrel-like domain-containing protein [Candidatus Cyrtobacter comes]MDZ5762223.1 putative phage domain protein [Candidatus Cyrtobacter comes]
MASIILSDLCSSAIIDRKIGKLAGALIKDTIFGNTETRSFDSRLGGLLVKTPTYGSKIPFLYGAAIMPGEIIWTSKLEEITNSQERTSGGKTSRVKRIHVSFYYRISLAISICSGPISELKNIFANGIRLEQSAYKIRIYSGSEHQMPDPLIESIEGIGNVPAYRGIAYIIFEDLDLSEFENKLPEFTFEVVKIATHPNAQNLQNSLKEIILLPGHGEFTYEIKPHTMFEGDYIGDKWIQRGKGAYVNVNNCKKEADSIYSLEKLFKIFPNLEWISVTVAWFCSEINIKDAKIEPKISKTGDFKTFPKEWSVGHKYTIKNASIIQNKRYQGTVSDNGLYTLLDFIKSKRNAQGKAYKIMLRPIVLMDTKQLLDASIITGQADYQLNNFFNKNYNDFIKHYACLCGNIIDAISIGSGLIGITSIKDNDNNFPGIDNLINLSKEVKELLPSKCLITYSSDINEYHENSDGWYNMDKLWTSRYIDFIGININSSSLSKLDNFKMDGDTINNSYFDDLYNKLAKWYFAEHKNPDDVNTDWKPGLKKVWLTECGYIAAKNDNQSIFKKRLINYHIKKEISFIDKKFVLGWDVRPQSKQNEYDIAQDLNNKLSNLDISSIIFDIFKKCNVLEKNINVDINEIDSNFKGIIIGNNNAKSIIDTLCTAYDLSLFEKDGKLVCIQDSFSKEYNIEYDHIVKSNNTFIKSTKPFCEIPTKLSISYFDKASHCELKNLHVSICDSKIDTTTLDVNIPLVLYESEARELSKKILYKLVIERHEYNFILPSSYLFISISDNLILNNYLMKVSELDFGSDGAIKIKAFSIQKHTLSSAKVHTADESAYSFIVEDNEVEILDIPTLASEEKRDMPRLFIAVANKKEEIIRYAIRDKITEIKSKNIQSTIGVTLNLPKASSPYITDTLNKLVINLKSGELESISDEDFLSGKKNIAIFGREIIIFKNAKLLDKNKYKIDTLLRGRQGTEKFINTHTDCEKFILLDDSLNTIYFEEQDIKENINFEYMGTKMETKLEAYNLYPLPVSNLYFDKRNGRLSWNSRIRGFAASFGYCDIEESLNMYTVIFKNNHGSFFRVNTKNTYIDIPANINEILINGAECSVAQISNIVGMGEISSIIIG